MKWVLLLICGLVSCKVSKTQGTTSCYDEVVIGHVYGLPVDRIQDTLKKQITFYFESGFNDTLSIFINDSLIMNDYFKTDFSTSSTTKNISFEYYDLGKKNIDMKIIEKNNKFCLDQIIEKGYRIVAISRYQNKWRLNYTNYKIVYE